MSFYAINAHLERATGRLYWTDYGPAVGTTGDEKSITLKEFNEMIDAAFFCGFPKRDRSLSGMRINSWQELSLCQTVLDKLETVFQRVLHDRDPENQQFLSFKTLLERFKLSALNAEVLEMHSSDPISDPITCELHRLNSAIEGTGTIFGVCILTNEKCLALHKLFAGGGVHVGVSAWHNFDIMAKKKSERGILVDFNPSVSYLLRATLHFVRKYEDRKKFLEAITPYLASQESKLRLLVYSAEEKGVTKAVAEEFEREGSWLFSDEAYGWIRQLALGGKIAVITGNMSNQPLFEKIGAILSAQDLPVSSIYASNVFPYFKTKESRGFFVASMGQIAEKGTKLIAAAAQLRQYCATYNGAEGFISNFFHKPSAFIQLQQADF